MPRLAPGDLRPVQKLRLVKGIAFPKKVAFRQLIVTGPPGSGKSTLIQQIGGWREEGFLDLTGPWWRSKVLALRPREVHLGIPFRGCPRALALFEDEWIEAEGPFELEVERIRLPPRRGLLGSPRKKFVFEFLLPPAEAVYEAREARSYRQSHHIDTELSVDRIREQLDHYGAVGLHLRRNGVKVYVRDEFGGDPKAFASGAKSRSPTPDDWRRRVERALEDRMTGPTSRSPHSALGEGVDRIRLSGNGTVIDRARLPIELTLRRQRIQVFREPSLVRRADQPSNVILVDPDEYTASGGGFLRLGRGERIRVGKDSSARIVTSRLADDIPPLLEIQNAEKAVEVRDLGSSTGTDLRLLADQADVERLVVDRRTDFARVREIYGGPFRMRAPAEALEGLRRLNEQVDDAPFRVKNVAGAPGGLVELPPEITPVIVGDLHTNLDNLLTVLTSNRHLQRVENGQAAIIILGDAVHLEEGPDLAAMDDSVVMMDVVHALMLAVPGRFIYVRGNHDSFSPDVRKAGVAQGRAWQKRLLELRGPVYVEEMLRFYELLPYVVMSDDFIACHAGPPRGKVSRKRIVEIQERPRLRHELTWNRIQRSANPAGYTKSDVKALRRALDLPGSASLIVSHNPQSEHETVWLRVGGVKNHHVVYSAHRDQVGTFTRVRQRMVSLTYPSEPLTTLAEEEEG